MRTKLLLAVSALTLSITSSAFAADMAARPYKAPPAPLPPAPVWNWTGLYLGGHLGGVFTDSTAAAFVNSPVPPPAIPNLGDDSAFLVGGQIGLNYQLTPNWLVGVEGDFSWTQLDRAYALGGIAFGERIDWLASVTGRLGYVWGPGMIYAKGGAAFRDDGNYNLTLGGAAQPFVLDRSTTGWTVGGGLEYMFAPNWSAKAEYQFYKFDDTTFTNAAVFAPATGAAYEQEFHTAKVGINYHFNFGGSSPVVARY